MIHAVLTWAPLIGVLPLGVGAVYLLIGTLMEPDDRDTVVFDQDDGPWFVDRRPGSTW